MIGSRKWGSVLTFYTRFLEAETLNGTSGAGRSARVCGRLRSTGPYLLRVRAITGVTSKFFDSSASLRGSFRLCLPTASEAFRERAPNGFASRRRDGTLKN